MILLCSEDLVKSVSNISDNVQGKYVGPALRETQEVDLTELMGEAMVDKLTSLVGDETIGEAENAAYKALLDNAQYFMAYTVVARLIPIVSFKIDNMGANQTSDDKISPLSMDDVFRLERLYQDKADWYKMRLQKYILKHRSDLPEINENQCLDIESNLYSAASTGMFLGGPRSNGWRWYVKYAGYDKP